MNATKILHLVLVGFTWCVLTAVVARADDEEIEYTKDIVYGTAGGEPLLLDMAMPKALNHAVPAVVWIHGGGWRWGTKDEFAATIQGCARAGYVAVTISYRFVPKHIFPAQVEDAKCAVRWLRANAAKYHVDPQRIGAVGSSAGAHLAMMLGTMDSADGLEGDGGSPQISSRVQAVVSYAGPTNLAVPFPDASKKLIADFVGGPTTEKADAARRASPITYVNAGDAPMLLIQGTKDTLVEHSQAIAMVEALSKAGVPGRLELMIGEGHGWPSQQSHVLRATQEFLDLHLKK